MEKTNEAVSSRLLEYVNKLCTADFCWNTTRYAKLVYHCVSVRVVSWAWFYYANSHTYAAAILKSRNTQETWITYHSISPPLRKIRKNTVSSNKHEISKKKYNVKARLYNWKPLRSKNQTSRNILQSDLRRKIYGLHIKVVLFQDHDGPRYQSPYQVAINWGLKNARKLKK